MLQTNNTGVCTQCLSSAGPTAACGAQHSGSTLLCQEPSEAGPRLHAPPRSKPLRLGSQVALRGADSVGPAFCALPRTEWLSVWRARSLRLITFLCCSVFWVYPGAPCQADGDCPAPPEVLAKKPACSLVGKVSPGLRLPPSSPYGSGCLSPAGDGLQPGIPFRPLFCAWSWVSYVRAFHMVAIPQSGLLAQVSLFWLVRGVPAQFLKSTAARTSCPSCPAPTC